MLTTQTHAKSRSTAAAVSGKSQLQITAESAGKAGSKPVHGKLPRLPQSWDPRWVIVLLYCCGCPNNGTVLYVCIAGTACSEIVGHSSGQVDMVVRS